MMFSEEWAMDRRQFLSTSVLSGLALAAVSGRAYAFSQQSCDAQSADPACRELIRHHELVAQLETALAKRGLDEAQRKAVLAAATCPFCGLPLIG
jgi:hypothetical protein